MNKEFKVCWRATVGEAHSARRMQWWWMVWGMGEADMIWRLKEGLSRERVDGKMSWSEDLLVKRKKTIVRVK